jgi:hypothetical protein
VRVSGPAGLDGEGTADMPKFTVLIYGDAEQWEAMTRDVAEKHDAAHVAFREAIDASPGVAIVGGEELELAPKAKSVRSRGGRVITTDGPFLETKEALGGYYVIEAPDIDAVVALASQLPEATAAHSGVEIRQVVDHG